MGRAGGGSGRSSGGGGGRGIGGRSSRSGGRSRSGNFLSSQSRSAFGSIRGYHPHTSQPYRLNWGTSYYRRGGLTTVLVLLVFLALAIAIQIVLEIGSFRSDNVITRSTIVREALPKGSVVETEYYTDDIGDWIHNATTLTSGMKNFYHATGVQPYLYITDSIDGNIAPSNADADTWMNQLYDELFEDEAHSLLMFYERDGQYSMWYLNGKQAKTVMDTEAMDILMDYVERYYYSSMTEDEMFSTAYDMAATRIMEITREPAPWYAYLFILVAVIVIISLSIHFWKARKAQRNIEDANTRAILEMPLEEIHNFPEE